MQLQVLQKDLINLQKCYQQRVVNLIYVIKSNLHCHVIYLKCSHFIGESEDRAKTRERFNEVFKKYTESEKKKLKKKSTETPETIVVCHSCVLLIILHQMLYMLAKTYRTCRTCLKTISE